MRIKIFTPNDPDVSFPDPMLAYSELSNSIPSNAKIDNTFLNYGDLGDTIAIGGDLSPERLVAAYQKGIFPFFSFRSEPITWSCPLQRFVIFAQEIHISHSMCSLMNSGRYHVTFDTNFEAIIRGCATHNNRIKSKYAWLGPQMISSYIRLHQLGHAHSVEVWTNGNLIGGLYGVSVGHCFCGESMFSILPNASKFALVNLAHHLQNLDGAYIIDCQYHTPHLASMGGRLISYPQYISYLS